MDLKSVFLFLNRFSSFDRSFVSLRLVRLVQIWPKFCTYRECSLVPGMENWPLKLIFVHFNPFYADWPSFASDG